MNRIEKLMKALPEGADAALITSDVNRRYFTGLGSTAGTLLAFRDAAYFIIDFRYIEVAKATVTGAKVILQDKLYDQLGELVKKHGARTVTIETDYITVGSLEQYRSRLPQVEFLTAAALNDKILEMRSLKDEEEIAAIRKAQSITDAAFLEILDFIKQNFTFRNLGIYISLTTGLRIGEICGLKWSDINTDNGTITVNRTIERIYIVEGERKHTELVINTPKTKNSCREIPMNKELQAMVKPLKKVVNTDFYVLTNEEKPTEPRTYRNYYHRLMKRLDIPRLKYHGLRHSFATRCIESNCDYKTVSVLLGHANITTTLNLYVHPNMEQKKRCITKMFKSLGK